MFAAVTMPPSRQNAERMLPQLQPAQPAPACCLVEAIPFDGVAASCCHEGCSGVDHVVADTNALELAAAGISTDRKLQRENSAGGEDDVLVLPGERCNGTVWDDTEWNDTNQAGPNDVFPAISIRISAGAAFVRA